MSRLACLLLVSTLVSAVPASAADTILNVSSLTRRGSGARLTLDAGTYAMRFIGRADGGDFDAWSAWNFGETTSGCNTQGTGCSTGWLNSIVLDWAPDIDFESDDLTGFSSLHPDGTVFATPEQALAVMQGPFGFAATSTKGRPSGNFVGSYIFTLAARQDISVRVADTVVFDNAGGVSLLFRPATPPPPPPPGGVPEPESWAMLIAGLGLTGAALRRRRALPA